MNTMNAGELVAFAQAAEQIVWMYPRDQYEVAPVASEEASGEPTLIEKHGQLYAVRGPSGELLAGPRSRRRA